MLVFNLPKSKNIRVYSLCEYIPEDYDESLFSIRLILFKKKRVQNINGWLRWSGIEVVFSNLNPDIIIRAYSSNETSSNFSQPMDQIGLHLSVLTESNYLPNIIGKKITQPIKKMKLIDRQNELMNSYFLQNYLGTDLNGKRLLIIDDVMTSGTTFRTICTLLLKKWPKLEISCFCLARSCRDGNEINLKLQGDQFFTGV